MSTTAPDNRVFIAACPEYAQAEAAVRRVLEAFGGAAAILNGRTKVLVKPNLVMPKKLEAAATTHPAVVAAVCRAFVEAGAKVSLIDSSAAPHNIGALNVLFKGCGMDKAAAESGAELCMDTAVRKVSRTENAILKEMTLLAPVLDAELVITLGKVKTHGLAHYTGAVKNLFGTLPGLDKPAMHQKFPQPERFFSAIVDICETVKPGFAILDGIMGMEGNGPTGGTPKFLGAILGGYNPYAADMAAIHLTGLRPERVHTQGEAIRRELVCARFEELELLGDDYRPLMTNFRPPESEGRLNWLLRQILPKRLQERIRMKRAPFPLITVRCVGCGECVRVCPQQTITMENRRAVVDTERCIKCYCCHEFCPPKAIEFKRRK